MPRVSVLLTSYNRSRFLPQAVRSVLGQTYRDFELIILDDNSPAAGGVPGFLASVWDHPKVRIYKDDVLPGERAAQVRYAVLANTGLSLARGELITYLCDDDWYAPGRLEVMAAMLDDGPSTGVVYGKQAVTSEDGQVIAYRDGPEVLDDAWCRVDHSSVMHTAEAGEKAGGWDASPEHWATGDAAFWRRLNAAGYSFRRVPGDEPLDYHRDHAHGVNKLGGPY